MQHFGKKYVLQTPDRIPIYWQRTEPVDRVMDYVASISQFDFTPVAQTDFLNRWKSLGFGNLIFVRLLLPQSLARFSEKLSSMGLEWRIPTSQTRDVRHAAFRQCAKGVPMLAEELERRSRSTPGSR